MADMAHAAVLVAPWKFEFRDMRLPEIGPEDGLLRMEAAGLCGTDYEQVAGHLKGTRWDVMPIVPGHEILGFIERIGAEAAKRWNVREGDRVVLETPIPCGHCFHCAIGQPLLCKSNMGYGLRTGLATAPGLWGGYATHVYLHPRARLHKAPGDIPGGVMTLFNPLANAVRWAYEKPALKMGESIVILGAGQRGLMAIVAAQEAGAGRIIITGTKRSPRRLELARALGAHAAIVADEGDTIERVRAANDGRLADVVLDCTSGSVEPVSQSVSMVRPGGKIVIAGLKSKKPVPIVTDTLVANEIEIMGAFSSSWTSIESAIDILKRRWRELAQVCTHTYPLAAAEKAVRVLGREITDGPETVHVHLDLNRAA